MKNRMAWGVAVVLAVLLLGAAGIGLHRAYVFGVGWSARGWSWGVGYGDFGEEIDCRIISVGPVVVLWWHR